MRYAGPDRYQTGLATALGLRGTGDFPFDSPDRPSGGEEGGWWGVGRCPRSVIVVAGDSPADALSASALSDPTGRSREPYLERTSAADPLFDPIGGFARVDTDFAPILVTASARSGASGLSTPTRLAAADLRSGGCRTAGQAIVVGGPSAVAPAVDRELISLGYHEVFRIAGADRFGTAAEVARSLGTAPIPPTVDDCVDPVTSDGSAAMGFYANAVVELREGPLSCRLLGRTVVLADGVTGADALAAGWWTSFWQVPVLLHGGSGELPRATAAALETLDVDNIVILGGEERVGPAVVARAEALAGARAVRIAGADRYATSVEMARRLGGWWPTGRGADFEGSLVCLAASSGAGTAAVGWPDALGAGPWCGAANGAAANPGAPVRALAPTSGPAPTTITAPSRPRHDAVPVLLVPAGAKTLPSPVAELLRAAFTPGDSWCSSVAAPTGCLQPGFAVGFGGAGVLTDEALDEASTLVSGGTAVGSPGRHPRLRDEFHTTLDVSPVFAISATGTDRVCAERDAYGETRWLGVFSDPSSAQLLGAADLMVEGRYVRDADGRVRSPGIGSPACVAFSGPSSGAVGISGVSLSGRATPTRSVSTSASDRFVLTGPLTDTGADATSGLGTALDPARGGHTTVTFVTTTPTVGALSREDAASTTSAIITIVLDRGIDAPPVHAPDRFTASWSVTTTAGTVSGTARGEAILDAGMWRLRGRSEIAGGSWDATSGVGGFSADLVVNTAGTAGDDQLAWQIDAVLGG